jgi:hypothetical protein
MSTLDKLLQPRLRPHNIAVNPTSANLPCAAGD